MVWTIETERLAASGTTYYLLARGNDAGSQFVLEAAWAQCLYILGVYAGAQPAGDAIVQFCTFADDDPGKFAKQVMRMTERDTADRLRRIASKLKDAVVMSHNLRRRCGM
jgi:hypothetical protein